MQRRTGVIGTLRVTLICLSGADMSLLKLSTPIMLRNYSYELSFSRENLFHLS